MANYQDLDDMEVRRRRAAESRAPVDDWDPRKDDFHDRKFNAYDRGLGKNMPKRDNRCVEGIELFVQNIPCEIEQDALRDLFSRHGTVTKTVKIPAKAPGQINTYGFIGMKTVRDAEEAVRELNGLDVRGCKLKVRTALTDKEKSERNAKRKEEQEFIKSLTSYKKDDIQGMDSISSDDDSAKENRGIRRLMNGDGGLNMNSSSSAGRGRGSLLQRPQPSRVPFDTSLIHRTHHPNRNLNDRFEEPADGYHVPGRYQNMSYGRANDEHMHYGSMQKFSPAQRYHRQQHAESAQMPDFTIKVNNSSRAVLPGDTSALETDTSYLRNPGGGYSRNPSGVGRGESIHVAYNADTIGNYGSGSAILRKSLGGPPTSSYVSHMTSTPIAKGIINEASYTESRPPLGCRHCGQPGRYRCTNCKIPYCSRLCQEKDWDRHKELCMRNSSMMSKRAPPYMDGGFEVSVGDDLVEETRTKMVIASTRSRHSSDSDHSHTTEKATSVSNASHRNDNRQRNAPSRNKKPVDKVDRPRERPPDRVNKPQQNNVPAKNKNENKQRNDNRNQKSPKSPKDKDRNEKREKNNSSPQSFNKQKAAKNNSPRGKKPVQNAENKCEDTTPTIFDLPKLEIDFNKDLGATACMVVSPSEIWMYIVSEMFVNMLQKLGPMCVASKERVTNVKVNNMYGSLFSEDGGWYRAKVDKILSDDTVAVTYVDFGNKETVPLSSLRFLDKEMLSFAPQAICCSIYDDLKDWDWSPEVCKEIRKIVLLNTIYTINVKKWIHSTYFITMTDEDGNSIADSLDNTKEKQHDSNCVMISNMETLYGRFSAGQNIQAVVVHVNSPVDFFVQIDGIREAEQFGELTQAIQHYDEVPYRPYQNEIVLAKFVDGVWYRAVVNSLKDSEASVQFIDFGNECSVKFDSIRKPSPQVKDVPIFGVKCALANVEQSRDFIWGESLIEFFQTECPSSHLMEGMVHKTDKNILFLELLSSNTKESISKMISQKIQPHVSVTANEIASSKIETTHQTILARDMDFYILPSDKPISVQLLDFSNFGNILLSVKLNEFDEMMKDLQEFCSKHKSRSKPVVGEMVCALYDVDNIWYRAEVKSLTDHDCTVYFLDYGNTENVPFDKIQKISSEFTLVPLNALKCSLTGVPMTVGIEDQGTIFVGSILDGSLTATSQKQIKDKCEIKLFTTDNRCVNEKCVNQIKALSVESNQQLAVVSTNTDTLSIESNKQSTVMASNAEKCSLSVGEVVGVNIVAMANINEIYVQLISSANCVESLSMMLNEYGANNKNGYHPTEGEIVLVKYEKDGNYYRAEIKEIVGNKYKISYCDFGYSDNVGNEELQKLPTQFLSVPLQAIRCSLVGVSENSIDEGKLEKFFEALSQGQPITAKCHVVVNNQYEVELFTAGEACLNKTLYSEATTEASAPLCTPLRPVSVDTPEKTLVCDAASFNKDEDCRGVVTDIKRSDHFYMVSEQYMDKLCELSNNMNKFYAQQTASYSPVVGELVCACWSDDVWYRAKVLSLDGNDIKIHFVDYGNSDSVPRKMVRKIDPQFTSLPLQAIPCALHNVPHVDDAQLIECLQHLQAVGKLKVKLIEIVNNVNVVELENLEEDGEPSYNAILVTLMKELGINESAEQAQAASESPKAQQACVNVSSTESSKRNSISSEQVSGKTARTIEYKKITDRDLDCVISFAYDPQHFYCQQFTETFEELNTLKVLTDNAVLHSEATKSLKFLPVPGDLCWALFEDGDWYRAKVEQISGDGQYTVFYLDYGNKSELPVDKLRPTDDRFTSLPALALKCSLHGIEPVGERWGEAAIEKMNEKVGTVQLQAHCVETIDGCNQVELKYPNTDPVTTVNEEFVKAGFAKYNIDDDTEALERQLQELQAKLLARKQGKKG